jgi:protein O-GlcNAc transferase
MVGKVFQQDESSIAHEAELYRLQGEDLVTQARFSEAETSFRHSLEINPNSAAVQCSLGKVLKRRGKLAEAEACYRRAIELCPDCAEYYYCLGNALYERYPSEAESCYGQAITLEPAFVLPYVNLGSLLGRQNRVSQEEACYRRAISLNPHFAEVHNNLGKTLRKLGKIAEAEECYRVAIKLKEGLAEAHYNLGEILEDQCLWSKAEVCYRRAVELKADMAEAQCRLGTLLRLRGCLAESEACYRQAIRHKPNFLDAMNKLGTILNEDGRSIEAAALFERVIALKPRLASAHSNRGIALGAQGRAYEEELCYRRAIELSPDLAQAHCNLGNSLKKQGKLTEARASYQRAILLDPSFAQAYSNLGTLQQEQSQLVAAEASFRRALTLKPDFAPAFSNLLFTLSHDPEISATDLFAEHCRFAEHFEGPLRSSWIKPTNDRNPDRCLNIGFVSGDLRIHPITSLIEPVIACLAGNRTFCLHAFANQVIEDAVSIRMRSYFQRWHPVAGLSDAILCDLIRKETIDILIDLSGHTARNRLLAFARKPAPIQASWIGYLGTTGLIAMDYYLADRFLLPQAEFCAQFTEKLIHLPAASSYFPDEDAPSVNDPPALTAGHVTFGNFNRVAKLNPKVIQLWGQLLRALPLSRMMLANMPSQSEIDMVSGWFGDAGVSRERLSFEKICDKQTLLELHHRVDICLDSFPYTGFTTTLNAIWMGVPTLTLAGTSPPGRQSAAVLSHLGLNEYIVKDHTSFVSRGVSLATDVESLCALRNTMRERFAASPYGQADKLAEGFGEALRGMWKAWCIGSFPAEE